MQLDREESQHQVRSNVSSAREADTTELPTHHIGPQTVRPPSCRGQCSVRSSIRVLWRVVRDFILPKTSAYWLADSRPVHERRHSRANHSRYRGEERTACYTPR